MRRKRTKSTHTFYCMRSDAMRCVVIFAINEQKQWKQQKVHLVVCANLLPYSKSRADEQRYVQCAYRLSVALNYTHIHFENNTHWCLSTVHNNRMIFFLFLFLLRSPLAAGMCYYCLLFGCSDVACDTAFALPLSLLLHLVPVCYVLLSVS